MQYFPWDAQAPARAEGSVRWSMFAAIFVKQQCMARTTQSRSMSNGLETDISISAAKITPGESRETFMLWAILGRAISVEGWSLSCSACHPSCGSASHSEGHRRCKASWHRQGLDATQEFRLGCSCDNVQAAQLGRASVSWHLSRGRRLL